MTEIKGTNVTIMVKDMDKAIGFYESIGLTLQNRWENYYAMVTAPGVTLGIHPASTNELGSGTVSIGFMVDQLEEAKSMLETNQIPYTPAEDKGGMYLNFKDPDGTLIYFIQVKW